MPIFILLCPARFLVFVLVKISGACGISSFRQRPSIPATRSLPAPVAPQRGRAQNRPPHPSPLFFPAFLATVPASHAPSAASPSPVMTPEHRPPFFPVVTVTSYARCRAAKLRPDREIRPSHLWPRRSAPTTTGRHRRRSNYFSLKKPAVTISLGLRHAQTILATTIWPGAKSTRAP